MDTLDSKNENQISDQAVNDLGSSAGWVIAFSVLLFLGSLFALIGGLQLVSYVPLLGFLYVLIAGGYGYLGYLLIMQGMAVNKYRYSKNSADFDQFASNYKKYWMFFIMFLVAMLLLILIIANSNAGRGMF